MSDYKTHFDLYYISTKTPNVRMAQKKARLFGGTSPTREPLS